MAHGENAERFHNGREYWSRRCSCPYGEPYVPYTKLRTHRRERHEAKKVVKKELEEIHGGLG